MYLDKNVEHPKILVKLLFIIYSILLLPVFALLYSIQNIRNPALVGTKVSADGKQREKYVKFMTRQSQCYFAVAYRGELGIVIHMHKDDDSKGMEA